MTRKQGQPLDGVTVLVVEDEAMIAMAIEDELAAAGAQEVQIAMSLREAEAFLDNTVFSVAVLDVRLSDGRSYGIAKQLFAKGVPVVVHSGHADLFDHEDFRPALFCEKPAPPNGLTMTVLKALDTSRSDLVGDAINPQSAGSRGASAPATGGGSTSVFAI